MPLGAWAVALVRVKGDFPAGAPIGEPIGNCLRLLVGACDFYDDDDALSGACFLSRGASACRDGCLDSWLEGLPMGDLSVESLRLVVTVVVPCSPTGTPSIL